MLLTTNQVESDNELFRCFTEQRDQRALQTLIDRNYPQAFRVACFMLKNPAAAEDAVQEAFISCVNAATRFRQSQSFKPWFHAILFNSIRKEQRKAATRTRHENAAREQLHLSRAFADATSLEQRQELEALLAELQELPTEDQAILILYYFEGQNLRAISETLGIPKTTLNRRLQASLERLRKRMVHAGFSAAGGSLALSLQQFAAVSKHISVVVPSAKAISASPSFMPWTVLVGSIFALVLGLNFTDFSSQPSDPTIQHNKTTIDSRQNQASGELNDAAKNSQNRKLTRASGNRLRVVPALPDETIDTKPEVKAVEKTISQKSFQDLLVYSWNDLIADSFFQLEPPRQANSKQLNQVKLNWLIVEANFEDRSLRDVFSIIAEDCVLDLRVSDQVESQLAESPVYVTYRSGPVPVGKLLHDIFQRYHLAFEVVVAANEIMIKRMIKPISSSNLAKTERVMQRFSLQRYGTFKSLTRFTLEQTTVHFKDRRSRMNDFLERIARECDLEFVLDEALTHRFETRVIRTRSGKAYDSISNVLRNHGLQFTIYSHGVFISQEKNYDVQLERLGPCVEVPDQQSIRGQIAAKTLLAKPFRSNKVLLRYDQAINLIPANFPVRLSAPIKLNTSLPENFKIFSNDTLGSVARRSQLVSGVEPSLREHHAVGDKRFSIVFAEPHAWQLNQYLLRVLNQNLLALEERLAKLTEKPENAEQKHIEELKRQIPVFNSVLKDLNRLQQRREQLLQIFDEQALAKDLAQFTLFQAREIRKSVDLWQWACVQLYQNPIRSRELLRHFFGLYEQLKQLNLPQKTRQFERFWISLCHPSRSK